MDECIDSLGKAAVFFTLDANSEYWKVGIDKRDRDKTAFRSHQGLYRLNHVPVGLKNAPGTFRRTIHVILAAVKWKLFKYTWMTLWAIPSLQKKTSAKSAESWDFSYRRHIFETKEMPNFHSDDWLPWSRHTPKISKNCFAYGRCYPRTPTTEKLASNNIFF